MSVEAPMPFACLGACPACGGISGFRALGGQGWGYCSEHRLAWESGWRHATEQDVATDTLFEELRALAGYRVIDPALQVEPCGDEDAP